MKREGIWRKRGRERESGVRKCEGTAVETDISTVRIECIGEDSVEGEEGVWEEGGRL